MLDEAGKVSFINEAWKDLFSYVDYGQDRPEKSSFYLDNDSSFGAELFLRKILTGMENKEEIYNDLVNLMDNKEGKYAVDLEQMKPMNRFINLYSNPCVSDKGRNFGRIFVARDVSHQKEVDRLKMELINTVSHELRTPMSSILGFSELLLTRKLTKERNREYISIINSEARRLTDLINDFLDIQRMESGKEVFNKKNNSILEIVKESIQLFKDVGSGHEFVFNNRLGKDVSVYCDGDKIIQVLSNLLSNAVKYSPQGGEITINLTLKDRDIQIGIRDQGLGIPEKLQEKIFSKFYRIDNDDRREIGGTGLGLSISQEIIRAHGGDIWVKSTYGQGSTFYFNLPLADEDTGGENGKIRGENFKDRDRDRLLIVEDDIAMVRLIKEILKDVGLEMDSTDSGEEAIELANEIQYKLFILDIALKNKLNGWDVVKELKNNPSTANTPIIISSIYENKNETAYSEILDYLVKPFEPKDLIKLVKKALNGNLDSKMMVNSNVEIREEILNILDNKGIRVKSVEYLENMLIISFDNLEGKGGY